MIDEAARHRLYTDLETALGPDSTSTLMSLLPPVGWADVATKQDLRILEHGVRAEIADLRSEVHREIGSVHKEIGSVHHEIGALRTEMHTSIRMAVFSMIGAMFTLAGLTWAATALTV